MTSAFTKSRVYSAIPASQTQVLFEIFRNE